MDFRLREKDERKGTAFSTVARGLVIRLWCGLSEGEDLDSGFRRNDGPRAVDGFSLRERDERKGTAFSTVARGLVPRLWRCA